MLRPSHEVQVPLKTGTPLKDDGALIVAPNATTDGGTGPVDGSVKPRILLVSAMFPLPKAKYSQEKYNEWMKNYLDTVTTDIYLYTTPELGPQFQALRHAGLTITIDTTYNSAFEIPPLKGKEIQYQRMEKNDRSRHGRRSANKTETYAVHNSKLFFLHSALQTVQAKGKRYEYAFWNGPASFKDQEHEYREWPFPDKVQQVWKEGSGLSGTKEEDLIFIPIFDMPHSSMSFWSETMGPIDSKFSEGTFFGGTPKAIDWFARTFYAYHDHYLSLEEFLGKDESLINSLFLLFPERFITVWHNDPQAPAYLALKRTSPEDSFLGQCGSVWHYYQFWLAHPSAQTAMRNLWIRNAIKWRLWGWWRHVDRTPCQETRVLDMKDVLRRRLGAGWNAPQRVAGVRIPEKVTWS
ncbi:hypothetical protein D9613_002550 [Agrocybe pediades]|uniref:Uncharacterized protein n=1 Tax=Agrocybe pediades TaxID=84607 RepID=A0A8H4QNZ3_9AGAR|nr:hypothetical protein D9613_002550 [Agrocybe pediades]